jgi:hypothetical protein
MKLRFLPVRSKASLIRLTVLLLVFAICLLYVFVIYKVKRSNVGLAASAFMRIFAARVFEASVSKAPFLKSTEIEGDAKYAQSLASQLHIAELCDRYLIENGHAARSVQELGRYGLPPSDQVDPWGRIYHLRLAEGQVQVIHSTGPSGVDRLQDSELERMVKKDGKKFVLVGDNLVVFKRPSRP